MTSLKKIDKCNMVLFFQVGNLSMLFMLLFFIFSSLGMELFGKLGNDIFTVASELHKKKSIFCFQYS